MQTQFSFGNMIVPIIDSFIHSTIDSMKVT
jgi:hypothetical protein